MLSSQELGGVMGMMPSFATPDAVDIKATATIDVDNLKAGVDRIINDGINVIATTGTYGECYNLLWDEFETLCRATVEVVNKRVPLFLGCTSPNPREVLLKMKLVRELGADGVLLGVPYYEPSTMENAVQFYHDVAELFPDLGILIYHNPENHKFTIPVAAFKKLVESPNIIGMKDSHRTTNAFMNLQKIIKGHISVFVNQMQLLPYHQLGAAGCWSTEVWMGPWPIIHLLNLVKQGENDKAREVIFDLAGGGEARPGPGSKRPAQYADYCDVGPTRVPFLNFTDGAIQAAQARAKQWMELSKKYRPLVEAEKALVPA